MTGSTSAAVTGYGSGTPHAGIVELGKGSAPALLCYMAVAVGFEPTEGVNPHALSRSIPTVRDCPLFAVLRIQRRLTRVL